MKKKDLFDVFLIFVVTILCTKRTLKIEKKYNDRRKNKKEDN